MQFKVGSRSPPLITAYCSNQSVKSVLIREIRVSYKSAKSAFPPFGNSLSTMHHPGLAIYSKSKKSSDFKNSFAHIPAWGSFFSLLNLYFFYIRMLAILLIPLLENYCQRSYESQYFNPQEDRFSLRHILRETTKQKHEAQFCF